MKHYSRLKTMLVASVAALTLSSCLDTDDPDFAITGGNAYMLQETDSVSSGLYYRFLPVIQVMANDAIADYSCSVPSIYPLEMEYVPNYYNMYIRTEYSSAYMVSEYPSGNYTVQVANEAGETASYTFSFPAVGESDLLGYIEITEAPTFENGRLSVAWAEVENADMYYVYIFERGEELYPVYISARISATSYDGDGASFTIDQDDMELYGLQSGTQYNVCVVAVSESTTSTLVSYSDKTLVTL